MRTVQLPISVKNMETKKQIRQEVLALRKALDENERARKTAEIILNIRRLPEFEEAKQVLLFVGYGSEPDTLTLIKECLKTGKKVFCPVVLRDEMEFYQILDAAELTEGYMGIMEPEPEDLRKYVPGDKDFMLLPGTAFDREGNRIGYGKGFYDKYLAQGFSGNQAAAAFSFQVLENGRIPAEPTDRKIKCIVTEQEIIRI